MSWQRQFNLLLPIDIIKNHNFKGVEHRIEYVDTIDEVEYYNDFKLQIFAGVPAYEICFEQWRMDKGAILLNG